MKLRKKEPPTIFTRTKTVYTFAAEYEATMLVLNVSKSNNVSKLNNGTLGNKPDNCEIQKAELA